MTFNRHYDVYINEIVGLKNNTLKEAKALFSVQIKHKLNLSCVLPMTRFAHLSHLHMRR